MPKNEHWTNEELEIVLGYYLFARKEELKKNCEFQKHLAEKMSSILNTRKRTASSIYIRTMNYRSYDPEYNGVGLKNGGNNAKEIFEKYVTKDPSKKEIAKIWIDFINNQKHTNEEITKIESSQSKDISNDNLKASIEYTIRYNRSEVVKDATLRRANGVCELCGSPAPFITDSNKPYLEVHHIISLGNNGQDSTNNTIALCPNCHRKLHYCSNISKKEREILNNIKKL